MIRPIDTQILYPNAPEMSNRQQVDNQKSSIQQGQFAEVMQKEQKEKKEKISHLEEGQKMGHINEHANSKHKKNNKSKKENEVKKNKKTHLKETYSESEFDIRI